MGLRDTKTRFSSTNPSGRMHVRHMVAVAEDEDAVARVDRTAYRVSVAGVLCESGPDILVREEPLEIRINQFPIAVLMRTPGDDEALVRGFLLTEGIILRESDIASLRPCSVVASAQAEGNVMLVRLEPHVSFDPRRFRRNMFTTSSCGICGKATVEAALRVAPPLPDGPQLLRAKVLSFVPVMRRAQAIFNRTGGLHAAGAFVASGEPLAICEDIGRHNAVDKVVGAAAAKHLQPEVLVVSGRVSFEIAQKALAARIPVVVAVSAPSALAVELAHASGMTIVAFARGERMVVYADRGRLVEAEDKSP